MNRKLHLFLSISFLLSAIFADDGCTDPLAQNYDPSADIDDGTCEYAPTFSEPGGVSLSYDEDSGSPHVINLSNYFNDFDTSNENEIVVI